MNEFDLFSGSLDDTLGFLEDKKKTNDDGLYRIDLNKAKDKKKGYRSKIRFLPNLTKEGKIGQSAIEKISHFVKIKDPQELSGWFDSPKNFKDKCPLSDLYYTMSKSNNAIIRERAECLNYSHKYYSYVLVIEDENQPELVGKIMIFQYGKVIKDKILSEKNGEITGTPCNVFDWAAGKDFVVLVRETGTGDKLFPDYKNSMFVPETSSLPIYFEDQRVFKNVPLQDGKVSPKAGDMIKSFLMKRDHDLEEFAPKRWSEEQHAKVNEIIAFLSGKNSSGMSSKPQSDDFDFGDVVSGSSAVNSKVTAEADDEDDFFKDFG